MEMTLWDNEWMDGWLVTQRNGRAEEETVLHEEPGSHRRRGWIECMIVPCWKVKKGWKGGRFG
jgi:hypothetical protein